MRCLRSACDQRQPVLLANRVERSARETVLGDDVADIRAAHHAVAINDVFRPLHGYSFDPRAAQIKGPKTPCRREAGGTAAIHPLAPGRGDSTPGPPAASHRGGAILRGFVRLQGLGLHCSQPLARLLLIAHAVFEHLRSVVAMTSLCVRLRNIAIPAAEARIVTHLDLPDES